MEISNRARYLRVSLLSACNLNCFYCRPSGHSEGPGMVAPYEKVAASIRLLYDLGVRKVRFTGGEPILYKRLPELLSATKSLDAGICTAVTTNAVRLELLAEPLAEAGLDSVNISLDTLDRARFQSITGRDAFDAVKAGIIAAKQYLPEVKLNCVLMRDVNDHEAEAMVTFADRLGIDIRFIEYMPNRHSPPGHSRFISGDGVRARLPFQFRKAPSTPGAAATYYTAPGLAIRVGFISPVSHPFCAECDRLRLRADGQLFGCLFSAKAVNLYDLLGRDPALAQEAVEQVWNTKRLTGCQSLVMPESELPSFLSLGG